jgi:hypothetical protein
VLTDGEGKFTIERLADRRYSVLARGPEAAGRGSIDEVAIGARVRIELEMLGSIRGRVHVGATPVERFVVDAGELSDERDFMSADGSFELPRLRPGKHHLTVTSEQGAIGIDVEVAPGREQKVDVALQGWGTVTGTIVSAIDRAPLAGVTFGVESSGGVRDKRSTSLLGLDDKRSASDGRFEVSGIGGGTVTLKLSKGSRAMGEQLGRHTFELEPGATIDIGEVLALPPADVPAEERGWLGYSAKRNKNEGPLLIDAVDASGPAARLRVGDRIIGFDGIREADVGTATLLDAIRPARMKVGTTHTLTLLRGDDTLEVSLTVVERPE